MSELLDILSPVLGDELAEAIIEHRRCTVKKPLTAYAAKLQVKEYLKTGDPKAAAEMQILRSWQAIRADWYFREIAKESRPINSTGRRTIADVARDYHARNIDSNASVGLPRISRH